MLVGLMGAGHPGKAHCLNYSQNLPVLARLRLRRLAEIDAGLDVKVMMALQCASRTVRMYSRDKKSDESRCIQLNKYVVKYDTESNAYPTPQSWSV